MKMRIKREGLEFGGMVRKKQRVREAVRKSVEGEEFLITKGTPFGEFQINISEGKQLNSKNKRAESLKKKKRKEERFFREF